MEKIDPNLSTIELLKLAIEHKQNRLELSKLEHEFLINLLKERGRAELEYGEELALDNVRLIRRVTGAVGVYFDS